ncbi:hypothetical protein BDV95DRAFT_658737 [Massariosphaeria phaeospora]|uniref:Uncharacterized protein n=1 Tax=Massariosphaeria phaeospora TaxID=100035 RepID=A0A7C8IHJ7_9PLEO|nr:hypothetical protein BDV95DRAFT_658737 [Massariosphaeria phaeospora]
MQRWMDSMRQKLHDWLVYFQDRARDEDVKNDVDNHMAALDHKWNKGGWRPDSATDVDGTKDFDMNDGEIFDVATGEIYNEDVRQQMETSMGEANEALKDLNEKRKYSKDLANAVGYWEDFHYYQNVWNRRNKLLEKNMSKEKTRDFAWDLIRLYNKWGIGVRDKMPEKLGPDILHRYPQDLRITTKWRDRQSHLREKFSPRGQQNQQANTEDVETLNHETEDAEAEVQVDKDAIEARRKEVEDKPSGFKDNSEKLLPPGHKKYYSAFEHKVDGVKTSWERKDWGLAIAKGKWSVRRGESHVRPDKRKRYKTQMVPSIVQDFTYECNGDGTPKVEAGFLKGQRGKPRLVEKEVYVLDENDQRIPIPETQQPILYTGATFKQRGGVVNKKQYPGRRDAYDRRKEDPVRNKDIDQQFSEAGSEQPDESRRDEGQGDDPPSSGPANTDNDDEDDGDLFTKSYLACSKKKCNGGADPNSEDKDRDEQIKLLQQAGDLLKKFQSAHGTRRNVTAQTILGWIKDNLTNEQMEEKYKAVPKTAPGPQELPEPRSASGASDSDSTSDNGDDETGASHKQVSRLKKAQQGQKPVGTETIEVDPTNPKECRAIYRYTITGSATIHTQIDIIPELNSAVDETNNKASEQEDGEKNEAEKDKNMYYQLPRNPEVPKPQDGSKKNVTKWLEDKGRNCWVRNKEEWRPVPIVRKFRKDTHEYVSGKDMSRFLHNVDPNNPDWYRKWNSNALQIIRRDTNKKTPKPPWTDQDRRAFWSVIYRLIQREGITTILNLGREGWVENNFLHPFNQTLQQLGRPPRDFEAIRGQFRHAKEGSIFKKLVSQAKNVEDLKKSGKPVPDAEESIEGLTPDDDVFEVPEGKSKGRKRKAPDEDDNGSKKKPRKK